MAKSKKITVIGSGNVGWHLARHLEDAGHQLCEVYSLHLERAQKLANNVYDATATDSLDFSESKAEIFLLAVADDAIATVAEEIILPEGAILAHTSGSKSIRVLGNLDCETGVFYPLQTFSQQKEVDFTEIPILVEAHTRETEKELLLLAKSLSRQVRPINSEQRKTIHLAAVFACNFTNHLLSISKNILEAEDLSFDLLKPLIAETVEKALELEPEKSQTGPAARKDMAVVKSQYQSLLDNPELAQIYKLLSESIMERKIQERI